MRAKILSAFTSLQSGHWSDKLFIFVLAIGVYFSLFSTLGEAPLAMWDEARYANNALDLFEHPHLFRVTHLSEPDSFNTKPALVIGLQAICMRLFGISEFAVRLPSALFGLLTLVLVYLFSRRFFKNSLAAWLSAAILLCSSGFMSGHNVRTGDLDAALVFWLMLGLFTAVDLVVNRPENSRKHYLLLALSVIGGFLTKGIAAFFFLPYLLLIPLIFRRFYIFRDKNLYLSGLVVLVFCAGYYALRELYMPGYLELVYKYEWKRYTEEVMSWQVHPFFWYLEQMATLRFYPFIYFLPLSLVGCYYFKNKQHIAYFSLLLTALGYFLFISYPAVKLLWYDAPLFPVLALLVGLPVGVLLERLFEHWRIPQSRAVLYFIFLLLLIQPYRKSLALMREEDAVVFDLVAEGNYLRQLHHERPDLKKLSIYKIESHAAHYDQLLFYIRKYTIEAGYAFRLSRKLDFETGGLVLISKAEDQLKARATYQMTVIHQSDIGILYRIDQKIDN